MKYLLILLMAITIANANETADQGKRHFTKVHGVNLPSEVKISPTAEAYRQKLMENRG